MIDALRVGTAKSSGGVKSRFTAVGRHRFVWVIANGAGLAAVLAMTIMLVALAYAMNHMSYSIWGAFWAGPVLLILSLPVVNRARHLDGDGISRIVLAAAALKIFVMPLLRYWMAFSLYGGSSDAAQYDRAGALLAPLFRQGIYRDLGEISGTRFLEIVTGHVYALIGPTRLGGFMAFSFLSFLGCYLFYRAFRIAYPEGDGRRYALLVFFFPTLMFWPSSIGKEAFMMLVLGGAAVGAAQLFAGRLRGLGWLALGIGGAAVLRPHMSLLIGVGLAMAAPFAVVRPGPRGARRRGQLGAAVLLVSLLLASSTLIGAAERFFGLESLNTQTAGEQLDETTRRSGQGGSEFTPYSPNNPVGFVMSGVTILFRPFPFEVGNAQALLTSVEGLVLFALFVVSLRRLVRLPAELFRRPYVACALVYVFAFIYAFSSIVNFGILARQRAQLLPLLFVILCVPRTKVADVSSFQNFIDPTGLGLEEVER